MHSNDSLLPGNQNPVIDFDLSRARILNSGRTSYIKVLQTINVSQFMYM